MYYLCNRTPDQKIKFDFHFASGYDVLGLWERLKTNFFPRKISRPEFKYNKFDLMLIDIDLNDLKKLLIVNKTIIYCNYIETIEVISKFINKNCAHFA